MPILQRVRRSTLALASIMGVALPTAVSADPLNPLEFPSAGTVTLAAGQTYTINSTAGTFTGPSVNLTGTYRGNTLVFAFDALTVPATAVINTTGRKPIALLSRGDLSFAGTLARNGSNGGPPGSVPGLGGDGAGCGGGGRSGARNPGGGIGGAPSAFDTAGGSFGGRGGFVSGPTYGNLLLLLEGGSGGSGGDTSPLGGGGGAGGGAIEIGAVGVLSLNAGATITVNGGIGQGIMSSSAGSGSGGGVLLHAATVQIAGATVQAQGGSSGGPSSSGGGGRIAVQSANTPVLTGFSVAGGGGSDVQPGVITSARVNLLAPDLEFGDVAVGSSRTLFMAAQNTGDPDTSINGQFPGATAPFARAGDGIFSSVKPGRAAANAYSFAPTTTGDFSQQLTFLSNAGPVTVNVTGRGVVPACLGDLNADGAVNTADLTRFLGRFGVPCP